VNWSTHLPAALRAATTVFVTVLELCAPRIRRSSGQLAGLAFVVAAALPIQHLLLFDPDLAGARHLYLPVAGLAIFWASLLETSPPFRAWAAGVILLTFNIAALHHNLVPWRTVPATARAVCLEAGRMLKADPEPTLVSGLPQKRQGVYFLSGGFPDCVAINSGERIGQIEVAAQPDQRELPGHRSLAWDDARSELIDVTTHGRPQR
jgi:hypothetical protein